MTCCKESRGARGAPPTPVCRGGVVVLLLALLSTPTAAWVGPTAGTTLTTPRNHGNGPAHTLSVTRRGTAQPQYYAYSAPRRRMDRFDLASLATPAAEPASSSSSSPSPGNSTTASTAAGASPSPATSASSPSDGQVVTSGRVLEGGKVIDFSNLKASDRAEMALRKAREELLERQRHHRQPATVSTPFFVNGDHAAVNGEAEEQDVVERRSSTILGINQDVIDLVGHELGAFATPQEIQECAAYLRSKAPPGLLSEPSETLVAYTPAQFTRFRRIMEQAYFEAGEVTSAFAKTFYMGTMLLPLAARQAIWAVYVWCRRTDEIVDAPRDNGNEMLLDLSAWELRLENLFERGIVEDVYDLVLLDCRIQYPTMDITPYMDMIRGMLMDVPGLGQDRYDKFDELHLYCYRVAGTVGLMSLPIFGCAQGYDDETAREPALSLGVAFQLTNILRDVGEDAVKRGRVYLPQEDLERFGVTEDQIFEQRVDERYVNLMRFEIARARMYYERARRGVFMLAPESRLPVQSSLDAYGRILDKIEQNGYDSLNKRAYVDKWEKLSIIPSSWYRTLDISKVLPLPGDKPVLMDRI